MISLAINSPVNALSVPYPRYVDLALIDELTLLAMLVAGEARGEPWVGKIAVAWVARNRVEIGTFGRRYVGVILKRKQFSCFNEDDPNRERIMYPATHLNPNDWAECYAAAATVFFGLQADPTDGADHYHTKDVSPYWQQPERITTVIGHHIFYRITKRPEEV